MAQAPSISVVIPNLVTLLVAMLLARTGTLAATVRRLRGRSSTASGGAGRIGPEVTYPLGWDRDVSRYLGEQSGPGARRGSPAGRRLGALAVAGLTLVPAGLGVCAATSQAAAAARHQVPARQESVLIRSIVIARLSKQAVATDLRNARLGPDDPALGAGQARYGIVAYRVLYRTVNANGQPARASGLVAFPASHGRRLQLVDYGHGTTGYKRDVPSSFGQDASGDGIQGRWSAELFASAGFAVAEPDYVAMGAGPGRPEYMVAKSEVSASLDLIRAAQLIASRRGARVSPGVLVTGFSQGGSAAMAVGQALQHGAAPGFGVRALGPISGPYDLIGAELPGMFNGQVAAGAAVYLTAYALTAWNPLYHLYAAPGDAFRQPYAAHVEGLFDGSHPDQQIIVSLPPSLRDLPTDRYLRLLRHPAGALRHALIANSTCNGWTPRVPVRLYAASGDEAVTQVNAQHCQQAIAAHHGRVRLIQLGPVSEPAPGQPPAWRGHNLSAFIALPKVLRWFETLR